MVLMDAGQKLSDLKVGDVVHIHGTSGQRRMALVVKLDEKQDMVGLALARSGDPSDKFAAVIVSWDGTMYRSLPSERPVWLERPVYAKAVLKKLKTDDGITELDDGTHIQIGAKYTVDLMTKEMREWGHSKHPGKKWMRLSAVFTNENGEAGMMPVELFVIQHN